MQHHCRNLQHSDSRLRTAGACKGAIQAHAISYAFLYLSCGLEPRRGRFMRLAFAPTALVSSDIHRDAIAQSARICRSSHESESSAAPSSVFAVTSFDAVRDLATTCSAALPRLEFRRGLASEAVVGAAAQTCATASKASEARRAAERVRRADGKILTGADTGTGAALRRLSRAAAKRSNAEIRACNRLRLHSSRYWSWSGAVTCATSLPNLVTNASVAAAGGLAGRRALSWECSQLHLAQIPDTAWHSETRAITCAGRRH